MLSSQPFNNSFVHCPIFCSVCCHWSFNILKIFDVYALSIQIGSLVEVEVHNMYVLLAFVILFSISGLNSFLFVRIVPR